MFAKAILSLTIFTPAWGAHFRGPIVEVGADPSTEEEEEEGPAQLVKVNLTNFDQHEGPFDSLTAACGYCEEREKHSGPGKMPSPNCQCRAFGNETASFRMFCDVPPLNDVNIAKMDACKCNQESGGRHTCCSAPTFETSGDLEGFEGRAARIAGDGTPTMTWVDSTKQPFQRSVKFKCPEKQNNFIGIAKLGENKDGGDQEDNRFSMHCDSSGRLMAKAGQGGRISDTQGASDGTVLLSDGRSVSDVYELRINDNNKAEFIVNDVVKITSEAELDPSWTLVLTYVATEVTEGVSDVQMCI